MENASVIMIVCSHKKAYLDRYAESDKGVKDKDESWWPAPYWDIDAGMAALLGLLTVVDEGLGAVFTGIGVDYIRSEFNIPDEYSPIGSILIGYPEEKDKPSPSLKRGRRKLDNVIHYGSW
jgi:nitroreductase